MISKKIDILSEYVNSSEFDFNRLVNLLKISYNNRFLFRELYSKVYLKSKHWICLRDKIIEINGAVCEKCCINKAVNIHHLTYKNIGCEKEEDLIALCRECHLVIHKIGFKEKPLMKINEILFNMGYNSLTNRFGV